VTLGELTALMSRVGAKNRALMADRNVALFVQACIEEARGLPQRQETRPPLAPCDIIEV
tara:strand:- start:5061 stop:5237 length:177 start_codon:yes stop_codon:yes gene_type:complete